MSRRIRIPEKNPDPTLFSAESRYLSLIHSQDRVGAKSLVPTRLYGQPSCKFQHSVQEISIYERYKWTLSFDALFHFQMNMIDAISKIHYEFIKFSLSFRSDLRIHVEFWDRKKIRFDNFEFHATQKLSRDVTTHNTEDCGNCVLMIERSQR
jgi:hypothetical protein